MLSAALIFVSLLIGYVIVIGLMMLSTYGVASLSPSFAVKQYRLTAPYNLFLDLLWLFYTGIGAYIVATGAAEASPHLAVALLGLILLVLVWSNKSEADQRGMVHMLLTSLCITAGAAAGYLLARSA